MNVDSATAFVVAHQAVFAVGITHFVHLAWPKVKIAYPYLEANGGLKEVIARAWRGKKPVAVSPDPVFFTKTPEQKS